MRGTREGRAFHSEGTAEAEGKKSQVQRQPKAHRRMRHGSMAADM